jgi:hypothetical protein
LFHSCSDFLSKILFHFWKTSTKCSRVYALIIFLVCKFWMCMLVPGIACKSILAQDHIRETGFWKPVSTFSISIIMIGLKKSCVEIIHCHDSWMWYLFLLHCKHQIGSKF